MSTEQTTLGVAADFLSGFAWSASQFKDDGKMPIIRIQNMGGNDNSTFVYWDGAFAARFVVKKGDMLLSLSGSIKVDIWQGPDALLNQRIVKITARKGISERWLYWQLNHVLAKIEAMGRWALVNNVSVNDLKAFEILLPPLAEQIHIAQVLDQADRLRQQDRQLLAHYDQLVQAVFVDMFGDPVRNEKGWKMGTIRDITTEAKYGTSKPAEEAGAYPYLRMNNLTYEGSMDFSSLKYINLDEKEKNKYLVRKGDLLFNRTNSKELVGKTAVYRLEEEMAIAGYLIRVRTNEKSNSEYISGFLNSKYGKLTLLNMCKSIVGMANINAQELQNISIPVPPIDLQHRYAKIVTQIEIQKAATKELQTQSEALFQSLLQQAFRGELAAPQSIAAPQPTTTPPAGQLAFAL